MKKIAQIVAFLGVLMLVSAASALAGSPSPASKESCVAAGTVTPRMLGGGPWVLHPGDRKSQAFTGEAEYAAMPAGCEGVFRRTPLVKFQVQSPTSPSRWSDAGKYLEPHKSENAQREEFKEIEQEREEEGRTCWVPIPGGKKNTCQTDSRIGDEGGVGEVYYHPQWRLHEPSYSRHDPRLYRCTPGSGITHVRALFRSTITNVATGKTVDQRVAIVPVQVKRHPGKGPMPKAWRGAVRGPC